MLLAAELAGLLPWVISEGEHDGLSSTGLLDALDGGGLGLLARAGSTVTLSSGRPSALQVDTGLAWAELVNDVELATDEGTGLLSGGVWVEESVDVGSDDIDGTAKGALVCLPGVEGLGGGAGSVVSSALEGRLAGRDEAGEIAGAGVSLEDGLVTDDDKLDHAELAPGDDVGDLLLGT